ncbi:LysM peptidoglycan-binding domain-containing protein [Desulfobacula phenolica]|uniref:LysM domain-containing protein n=1 Tax=Desulfobacula phenolica TaxID=90732 RepID=A0A1H2ESS6_9BACT|nr:LysM domain-containing protein [Desulfobacula phenolica]SDT98177.1 LysM domain-containing protein [Desulfobacula phenolica]
MDHKDKPEAKISTAKITPNKKNATHVTGTGEKFNTALLKKNEFAMIIFGALLLTLIVFFLFFRSPDIKSDIKSDIKQDTKTETVEKNTSSSSFTDLEKRIENLEQALQAGENSFGSANDQSTDGVKDIDPIKERVTRLETAFLVKFDSLTERMGKIETSISQIKAGPGAVIPSKALPIKAVPPKVESKPLIPVKKAVKKEKKASVSHAVQKGETLYSISKKYNTSVDTLRKLNNMSDNAKIYPGNNIIIR